MHSEASQINVSNALVGTKQTEFKQSTKMTTSTICGALSNKRQKTRISLKFRKVRRGAELACENKRLAKSFAKKEMRRDKKNWVDDPVKFFVSSSQFVLVFFYKR